LNWISIRPPVPIIRVRIATLINKNSNFLLQTGSYTRDFTLEKRKKFDSTVSISTEKKGISSEECARECAADETNDCYHFEFCETMEHAGQRPTRSCRFTSGSPNPETAVDNTCRVYSIKSKALHARRPSNPDDLTPATPSKKSSNASGGVSPTLAVFFSLFFVGLATIGGVFGFRYFEKWWANRV